MVALITFEGSRSVHLHREWFSGKSWCEIDRVPEGSPINQGGTIPFDSWTTCYVFATFEKVSHR